MERLIILRLVLRGFMGLEAFDVEAFSGRARRSRQRLLANAATCNKQWIIASLDIDMAFLKGLAYQELAEATGEENDSSAKASRSTACSARSQALAPRARLALSHENSEGPRGFGFRPTSYDEEFEASSDLFTAKHVDGTNLAGTEDT
eukprot:6969665-Pyramimonas_sp.AAC.1